MMMEFITVTQAGQITTIALNRPDKRNAMHAPLIRELLVALHHAALDESRVLLIHGNGESFCAGGDISSMQKVATGSEEENYDDAQLLADLLFRLYSFPKPAIALAHGAVMGGGLGLLAACDIAIAAQDAMFGFSEVKIGITPSMISPYVIAAIGERAAHYYFLTGERFQAEEAYRIGLIQRVTASDKLMETGMQLAQTLLQNSPHALQGVKKLIRYVAKEKITEMLAQKTAEHLAELRMTPEAQEGLKAFMEKRKPVW